MKAVIAIICMVMVANICQAATIDVQAAPENSASSGNPCSDVNGDGATYTVVDFVHLMRYVVGYTPPLVSPENADVDLCGSINAADVALYMEFFAYGLLVGICEPRDPCYWPTGNNKVQIGCPFEAWVGEYDSIPLPIYITNDSALTAFSLGFHYDSDLIEIAGFDTSVTIIPPGWIALFTTPSDTDYVWPVPDSNMVLITCYRDFQDGMYLEPQEDGLLMTLWLRILSDDTGVVVDFDSAFVVPAGEFIFAPRAGGAVVPAYADCGTEDIVINDWICGDSNTDGNVDIDDVVFLINYIFGAGDHPDPIESADADCSGAPDIDDVVYLISYIFGGGNAPCDNDGDGEPDC